MVLTVQVVITELRCHWGGVASKARCDWLTDYHSTTGESSLHGWGRRGQ